MSPAADADRRRMAEYLAHHGPTHGPELRTDLGWCVARFWGAVYGAPEAWFAIDADGWWLSECGLRAVGAAAPV